MPWTAEEFRKIHNKNLSAKQAQYAAKIANAKAKLIKN
jgi:hypothetical protein